VAGFNSICRSGVADLENALSVNRGLEADLEQIAAELPGSWRDHNLAHAVITEKLSMFDEEKTSELHIADLDSAPNSPP